MNPFPSPISYPTYRPSVQQSMPGPQLDKVNGIDSARAFPTKPNSQIALFDANEDVMYIKTTDGNNFATIRKFRFIEEPETSQQQADTIKMDELFVSKEEFEKFKEEMLNGQQSIRNTKSNNTNNKSKSNEQR